ncbi:MAG: DivIVA domain-containing protein [Dialister sp.]|nr:DivIVA domain-containing protein [Dialister sp.]
MITPMDIHNKTFSRGLRGYSQEEVDAFLEELSGDYERIYREHREMEEEMDTIRTKLRNYEKMEATMSSTLVMAQETAENVKKNALKEAELAVREARNSAHKILEEAEQAKAKLKSDLLKAEADMSVYIEKVLANLKSATLLVESAKNTAMPAIVKEAEAEEKGEELPIEVADDRSADLFAKEETPVADEEKAETAEDEKPEETEETSDIVTENQEKTE